MSNTIILKKSAVTGNAPASGDLSLGEIAINYADGHLYYKSGASATPAKINAGDADTTDGFHLNQDVRSTAAPTFDKLRLTNGSDASLTSTLHAFQIGASSGQNLIIDGNEIVSRSNGGVSILYLQNDGGDVHIGANGGTGKFFVPAGTAAAPAITFNNDTNTGIYRIGADALGITSGGTLRAQFNSSGIVSSANVYTAGGSSFRNFSGVWQGTTGATGNGFQFVNSVDGTALSISSTGDTVASGTVKASSYFLGSSSEISLATTGAGSVFLRPNGQSTTGQMQLASTGNATFAGNIVTPSLTLGANSTVSASQTTDDSLYLNSAGTGAVRVNYTDGLGGFEVYSNNNQTMQFTANSGGITIPGYITHAGDTDTYFGFENNNAYRVVVGGAEALHVNTSRVRINKSISAASDSTYDIGTNATRFANVYADTLYGDGSNLTNLPSGADNTKLPLAGGNMAGPILLDNGIELRSEDTGGVERTITRVNSSDELEYGWSGAGPVKFMGGGSYAERMRIHTNGNVGIGTTSPAAKLHAYNSAGGDATDKAGMLSEAVMKLQPHASNSTNMLFAQVNSGSGMGIQVTNGPATADWDIALNPFGGNVGIGVTNPSNKLTVEDIIGIKRSGVAAITTLQQTGTGLILNAPSGYHPLVIKHNNTELVRFKNDGNVGIGTTTPSEKLHITNSSGTGSFVRFEDTGGSGVYIGGRSNIMELYAGGAERMRIDASGNVGIGTTSPSQKLHVSGNVDIDNGGILLQQGYGINLGISGYDIWMPTTTRVGIQTAATERLSILNNGNVGIGTASPNAILDISDATNDNLRIGTRGGNMNLFSVTDAGAASPLAFEGSQFNFITGNVGIGTTSPSGKLHVYGGSSGATVSTNSNLLAIETNGNNGLQFLNPSANNANINFGDPSNNEIGFIQYQHSTDAMRFRAGGTTILNLVGG